MIDHLQETQRAVHRALHVKPSGHDQRSDGWLSVESIGELIEFYIAQYAHLSALGDEMRWMRALPSQPYAGRVAELHRLHQAFLKLAPPAWVRPSLSTVLNRTLQLAASRMACDPVTSVDETLLAQIQRQQDDLDEAIKALLKYEAQLAGPVPSIPASALSSAA